jgi:NAD(P)-dependent dehydrogenase (short-subunit alcohol dehydrogenase family)
LTELRFDDRVVIVTGAGRGVGRSHALLLASKGARIVDTALDTFGRVDAVVNNAGIHDPGLFAVLTEDQFRTMLDVHYFGTLFVTGAAWPHFVRAGYGRVVNTVPDAMLGGFPELSSYGAAKAAVFGLTRNLATEGLPLGIRVNASAPRAFTRLSASHSDKVAELMSMTKETMDDINASMPPDLCAPVAAFLAHESCPLNGEVLQAGMGSVAVVFSPGSWRSPMTAEDIAENIDAIMDIRDAVTTDSAAPRM